MKKYVILFCFFLFTGCGTMTPQDFSNGTPKLDLFTYFEGKTEAWGTFEDRFGTIRRQFYVDIVGTVDGDVLVLDERFTYADGEQDQRVWTIRRLSDGTYEGRAADVIDHARGTASGNALHWVYDVDLKVGDSTYRVTFDDWMFLQQGDVLINRAQVTKWGFAVGEVNLFFTKP